MATTLFIRACAHRATDLPVVDSASASDPFVSIGAQTSVCVSEVVYDSNAPNWGSFCCDITCESECDVSFVVKDKGASFDPVIGSGSLPSSSAAGEHWLELTGSDSQNVGQLLASYSLYPAPPPPAASPPASEMNTWKS